MQKAKRHWVDLAKQEQIYQGCLDHGGRVG
jgi:hypothetical protein